ncbi:RDD family protein [Mucilaginibacter terrae]|uniref:RDD family membrane protein YckC n=1 Tax=Mucilaginibacter terrae TaxID=1955052 RepID=A0ABU3GXX5_9SPHI|nr:RDD family protein [Mucilaginibacter terrae]MDT3404625.1 putative RDD family membrane protein YckC [Mucilaginibacter terrae]
MDEFYVKDEKGERGPFTFEELTDGRLEPEDLVRTGTSDWAKAGDLDDFAEYFRFEGYYFPTETNLAGFGIRFLAYFIDHVAVSFIVGMGMGLFSAYLPFKMEAFDLKNKDMMFWLQEVYMVAMIVYNVIFCALPLSSTPGQAICRLIIVDAEGKKISIAKVIIRSPIKLLSVVLYGLGTIAVFFTQYRQGVHDLVAKTYVVKRDVL